MTGKTHPHAARIAEALAHHRAGRLDAAEALYRRVLAAAPGEPEALHLLAVLEQQRGRLGAAIPLFERALAARPKAAVYRRNFGTCLMALGRAGEAEAQHRAALALDPDFAEAHHSLGEALRARRRLADAERHYRRALALKPAYAQAHNGLGLVLAALGRYEEAETAYRAALAQDPHLVEAAINLAGALDLQRRPAEAEAEYRRALALDPGSLAANVNFGNLLKDAGRAAEAEARYAAALARHPSNPAAHNNLANLLKDQGQAARALDHFRRAVALDPRFAAGRHNALLTMQYVPGLAPEAIFEAHRAWGAAQPAASRAHANAPEPERRLRIGYLSADLRRHPVASFVEPLLAAHDREAVEVYCYALHRTPDDTSRRLEGRADRWRAIGALDDEAAADAIAADGIDVLVELAGHTASHRLGICARRPAPVQASYIGYPGTTGLPAIGYRITDGVADPPGAERRHTETLVRLEGCHLCFRPPADAPAVGPPPFARAGRVTFASFNNLAKTNPALFVSWARILESVAHSRLLLKSRLFEDAGVRARFHAAFARHGIAAERVALRGHIEAPAEHLALYNEVDIALDTDPYNGVTTTCEALWMGVPAVTRTGEAHVSRLGTTLLAALGLDELAAPSADGYVERAAALARDPARLAGLRASLRARMGASALVDGPALARKLEAAYRAMWRRWCASAAPRA